MSRHDVTEPEVLLARASWDAASLYRYERSRTAPRRAAADAAKLAEIRALSVRLAAEEAEAKKGGRPRKGIGAGHNVVAKPRAPRSKEFKRPEELVHGTRYSYFDRKCRCDVCLAWKESQRPETPKPRIRHGRARYRLGCRCEVCRGAEAAYKRATRPSRAKGKAA